MISHRSLALRIAFAPVVALRASRPTPLRTALCTPYAPPARAVTPSILRLCANATDAPPTATPTSNPTLPSTATPPQPHRNNDNNNVQLTLLYDGECSLCMKEVNMLRTRSDARGGTLSFIDIAADDYDEKRYLIGYPTAMGRIHALRADGSVVKGVQVFREAYQAVGLGWVYTVLNIPGVPAAAETIYNLWAVRRTQMTGRGTLEAVLRAREEKRSCR